MARVTVEDCLPRTEDRFELVILAAHRARYLSNGSEFSSLPRERDKDAVLALREIAEGVIDVPILRQRMTESLVKQPTQLRPLAGSGRKRPWGLRRDVQAELGDQRYQQAEALFHTRNEEQPESSSQED